MKAKTRTNQPVYYFFESQQDMTKLSGSFLNSLVAGDIVVKQTGEQQHAYIVSYKEDGTGICLTYTDASVVETISYDYVGSNWEYNSTDIQSIDVEGIIEGGTISNAKPIYCHPIYARDTTNNVRLTFLLFDNQSQAYDWDSAKAKIKQMMDNGASIVVNGYFEKQSKGWNAFILLKIATNTYVVYGNDENALQENFDLDDIVVSSFADGVNKIN